VRQIAPFHDAHYRLFGCLRCVVKILYRPYHRPLTE
jgi:hypothetical protein